jgi:hypothetical protein
MLTQYRSNTFNKQIYFTFFYNYFQLSMFARVCGRKYFFKFTMFTGGGTEPPLLVHLIILKNLRLCLQRHVGKGFARFALYLFSCFLLRPVFIFILARAVRCADVSRVGALHCAVLLLFIYSRAVPTCT